MISLTCTLRSDQCLTAVGQTQPAKEVPKVVRQNEQRQTHPVGHEPMTRQPSPVQGDFRDVAEADGIFVVVNGVPPDEGVMVELGMAIALGKPTFLFRDDFRRVVESEEYPLNLMLFTGLPEHGWEDYYYTSIDEIPSPEKALASWAKG